MEKTLIERLWSAFGEFSSRFVDWFAPCSKKTKENIRSCQLHKLSCTARKAIASDILKPTER